MPDTNDTDAILAKVRSGELSAGDDAAALIANLHAASPQGDAGRADCTGSAARASRASSRQPAGHVPAGIGRGCRTLAISRRFRLHRHMPPRRPIRLPKRLKRRFRSTLRHLQCSTPPLWAACICPGCIGTRAASGLRPALPAVNPYRQPAPDTTATLPALDATASQPEPETAYHQASPLPYNPSQETDKYIPVNEMESSSFFTDPEPAEEQGRKEAREACEAIETVRAERKAEKQKAKEEAKAAKAQKAAAGRRGAASPTVRASRAWRRLP